MRRLVHYIEHLRFRYGPRLARGAINLSAYRARAKLRDAPISVLIDNTVLDHATTHETAWISTGDKQWGPHTIATGYSARIPVHAADSKSREYPHIQFLPGLIALAQSGHLSLHTSAELQDEQFRQPVGRFRGYGYFDHNLFAELRLQSIDGRVDMIMGPSWMRLPSAEERQRQRMQDYAAQDADYAALVKTLGLRNSQDAWHIRTAEKHGLFCFLTMDFKLIETLRAQRNAGPIKGLATKVMTPQDLGNELGLFPIAPHILSYTHASFPVRSDLSWPDDRRRGMGKKRNKS